MRDNIFMSCKKFTTVKSDDTIWKWHIILKNHKINVCEAQAVSILNKIINERYIHLTFPEPATDVE